MFRTLAAILVISSARALAQSPQATEDQKRLQGIWRVREVVGSADARLGLIHLKLSFDGNQVLALARETPAEELLYTLDPTRDPKQINLVQMPPQPALAGKMPKVIVAGIYAFEQDRLKIRLAQEPGGRRPTDFSVKPRPGQMDNMLILDRDTSPETRDEFKDVRGVVAIRKLGVQAFSDDNYLKTGQRPPLYVKLDETTGDAHLAQIAPELKTLTRVTGLHLNGSQVTDDGLSFLEGIDNIGHINLEGTAVTDAGLNHLRKMTHLGLLIVTNTKVTEAGIASLKKSLPHLRVTYLSRAESDSEKAITKAGGIEYSDADGRLTGIRFTRVGLNDGTLHDLKEHLNVWKTTLRSIDLSNCQVTDHGLEALAGLTALEQLTLKGTDVTVAGVNSLKRTAPHLKVKH